MADLNHHQQPGAADLVYLPGFLMLGGGGAPGGHLDDQCANAALEKVKAWLT